MNANSHALGILISLCPSIEKTQELIELGNKRELKSEYWQGIYDSFMATNKYLNELNIRDI